MKADDLIAHSDLEPQGTVASAQAANSGFALQVGHDQCHDGQHGSVVGFDCCDVCVVALLQDHGPSVDPRYDDHPSDLAPNLTLLRVQPQLHPPRI